MPVVSIAFGLALILLGLDGYADLSGWLGVEHSHSPTALIPAYFGLALVVCGLLALKAAWLKHAMHAAAVVGLVAALGGAAMGWPKLPALLGGGDVARPSAVKLQSGMGVLGVAFEVLCVKSFIDARRRRAAA